MALRELLLPWSQQPQEAVEIDRSAIQSLGIVGGWIVGGSDWPPRDAVTGDAPQYSVGAGEIVGWRPVVSEHGTAAAYYDDASTNRIVYSRTGGVSARGFTFACRIRVNVAPGSPGVIARSGVGAGGSTLPLWRNGTAFDMRISGTDYTQAGTWSLGRWYDIEIVGSASSCVLSVDGVPTIIGGAAAAGTIDAVLGWGDVQGGGAAPGDFDVVYALWASRPWTDQERADFRVRPWQLCEPQRIWVPVSGGGGGAFVTLPGVGATASAGVISAAGGASATLPGASATASAGQITASAGASASVTLPGVSAAASAGHITAKAGASVTLAGAGATASAGQLSASAGSSAVVTLPGASAAASAGVITANGGASVTLPGASAAAYAGQISASAGGSAMVTLPGVSATAGAGQITASGGAQIVVPGLLLSASVGQITVSTGMGASVTLPGASASASAGQISAFGGSVISVPGVSAQALAGQLVALGDAELYAAFMVYAFPSEDTTYRLPREDTTYRM